MVIGGLLAVYAAVLPLGIDRVDDGPGVRLRVDGCGPAAYAAVRESDPKCRRAARRRLLATTTTGLLLLVVVGSVRP